MQGYRRSLVWTGLIAAPLAWTVNTQLGEVLPYADCGGAFRFSVLASSLSLLAAGLAGWTSWRVQPGDRTARFIARVSTWLAVIFAFALLLQTLAGFVLSGCER